MRPTIHRLAACALVIVALLLVSGARRALANTVTVDPTGVLVIDGKKTFPIGFTMPPPPDGKTPDGKNGIEELHDAGATFMRTGPMRTDWNDAEFALEDKYQAAAARYGMHCFVYLQKTATIPAGGDAAREALLRRIILRYKDNPGMGAWKHADEPAWGRTPVADMMRVTDIVRSLDPNHPIEVTQAPRGTVETLRPYNVTSDIIGADIYPISYPPGVHTLLPNKEISMVGDYTQTMKQVAEGKVPVWMTLQIAFSGVVKPGKTLRFPTFAEERFMTYEALIDGARGLLYFGGNLLQACTPEDAALGWNWHFWNRVLKPVIEEIGSKSPLNPALLAPDSHLPVTVSGAKGIEYCVREVGDEVFVLACKREGATEQATFSGLPADTGVVGDVMYESPRHVAVKNGSFTDWFGPFEVHVYHFRRAKAIEPRPVPGESHLNSEVVPCGFIHHYPGPEGPVLMAFRRAPRDCTGDAGLYGPPKSWKPIIGGFGLSRRTRSALVYPQRPGRPAERHQDRPFRAGIMWRRKLDSIHLRPVPDQPAAVSPNLVANPGMEDAALSGSGLVAGWEPLTLGAPAQFALDTTVVHGGRQSVRITAPETTRSYLRSTTPIAVAPGERLRISAWVRRRDVPVGQGTVIAIAEFADVGGTTDIPLAKVDIASGPADAWEKIDGIVTAPSEAANLRLRLGFSYSHGTCWWDDVSVVPESPLVLRIDLNGDRFPPSVGGVPILLLNRTARRGPVQIRVKPGTMAAKLVDVTLTGEPMQRVTVPIPAMARGKRIIAAALIEPVPETAPLFSDTRHVIVPPPLVLSPPSPTHWVVEDGTPDVSGTVDVAVTDTDRAGATLAVRVVDGEGKERAAWTDASAVADGLNAFHLQVPGGLPIGDYRIDAVLRPRSGGAGATPWTAEQGWHVIPRRQVTVTINAAGYLEQDGKAVFPLGMFNGDARMAEMGADGFTVTQAYNALRIEPGDPRPDDERAMDFLEMTKKAGMKAIFMVPMKLAEAGDWDGFRHRIRMFRNHPTLLAWEEEEGLARGDMKPATLTKIRAVLREEDPYHPFMIGDSRDVIGRVPDRSNFFPLTNMDLGMWWWYPLPIIPKATGGALEGDEAAGANGEMIPPTFLVQRNTDKPLWVGVQSYKKPGKNERYPTPVEYRAQAYIAMIGGAKGLLWYGGSVSGGIYQSPVEGHWEYLKTLVGELHGLAPVFMSPGSETPAFAPASAPISIMLKHAGGRHVLFVANRGAQPVDLSITLPPSLHDRAALTVPVLSESRSVNITGGKIGDRFDPYAVHVYEFSRETAKNE